MEIGRILKFASRAEHLAWRERWKNGRRVKLSWTSEQRNAILRQDEEYRQADAGWELNHGPISGGARVLSFLPGRFTWFERSEPPRDATVQFCYTTIAAIFPHHVRFACAYAHAQGHT
jgi:hypothetical protein